LTEPISAVICTLNEERNIEACIASVKGVDEVVVADDGSNDRTCEIARGMGARVFRRKDWSVRATNQDRKAFRARFGWSPKFNAGDRIRNGHLEAIEAIESATHDWVVVPDADERVSWDLPAIRELLPTADQITSEFVHSHNPDGTPERVTTITKMFRRSITKIGGRTHGAILPAGRIVRTDKMRVDHWQAPGHSQGYVLPIMEYSAAVDDDSRTRFYLGREYFYQGKWDHALTLLLRYLKDATFQPEIQKARVYQARCLWNLGRGDEAREAALQAVLLNPDDPQALNLMADFYFEPWSSKWRNIAARATSTDLLY
jgi:glycosyltransferase involved in cell wall biosynthesis